jgi:hypothetical protein
VEKRSDGHGSARVSRDVPRVQGAQPSLPDVREEDYPAEAARLVEASAVRMPLVPKD